MFIFGIVVGVMLTVLILASVTSVTGRRDSGKNFKCPRIGCGLEVASNNETYLNFLAAEHVEYHDAEDEDGASFRQINVSD